MRFFAILATSFVLILVFLSYFFCKINLEKILSVVIFTCLTKLACIVSCGYLLLWIPDLVQVFCTSTVSPKNRAVLITGCDSGFGHELAKRLSKKGFKVYACCLEPSGYGAQQLKTECCDSLEVLYLDVTDECSIKAAKEFVCRTLKESDLYALVNNAGVLKGFHIELSSMRHFEVCMQVNALGPVRVTRAFLPLLKKSKGRVINVCSVAGRCPCPNLCAYNMSKFAAVAFTEVLKLEMQEFGIRVVSIEPEFFSTAMCSEECISKGLEDSTEGVDDEIKTQYGERYIEQAKKIFFTIFTSASPNINLVLEAMEDGVCLKYPAPVYKPRRNIFTRIFFYIVERVPRLYFDMFFVVFFKCFGLQKPKSGVTFYESLMTI